MQSRRKEGKSGIFFNIFTPKEQEKLFLQLSLPRNVYLLFQLFQESLRFKVFWNKVVESSDHFVNLLFPGGIQIFSRHDGFEELSESLFHNPAEPCGNLNMDSTCSGKRGDP